MPRSVWPFLLPALLATGAGRAADHPRVPGFERFHTGPQADPARGGRLLLTELGCVNCHEPQGAKQAGKQGPVLDQVGARVKVSWLRKFLADPHAVKPGTTMPDLLAGGGPDRKSKVEASRWTSASTLLLRS